MNKPQKIYNLIAFSQDHIDAQTDRYNEGLVEWEIIKDMTNEEREARRRSKPPYVMDSRLHGGKSYRGSWLLLEDLLEKINK